MSVRSINRAQVAVLTAALCVGCTWSSAVAQPARTVNRVIIYKPALNIHNPMWGPSDPGAEYPRAVELHHSGSANGTLLLTFEKSVNPRTLPTFPIYRSVDGGESWRLWSSVKDTQHGWGLRWTPDLYELPQRLGSMSAGTLLLAGLSIPQNSSYISMDLYKSTDHGKEWTFVTTLMKQKFVDGKNFWEPFLLMNGHGKLICYFSDERVSLHSQILGHITSTDGIHWSRETYDVVDSNSTMRPGMPTVAKMGNGQYIMTYEMVGDPQGAAVHYKITNNPLHWGDPSNVWDTIYSVDGDIPMGAPYVVWTPAGGPHGMVIVSSQYETLGNQAGDYFVNYDYGKGNWYRMASPLPYTTGDYNYNRNGYSRSAVVGTNPQILYDFSGVGYKNDKSKISFASMLLGIHSGKMYQLFADNGEVLTGIPQSRKQPIVALGIDQNGANQKYRFTAAGRGFYVIYELNSGEALTFIKGKTVEAAYSGASDQLWRPEQTSTGLYKLISKSSGKELVVSDGGQTTATWAVENAE